MGIKHQAHLEISRCNKEHNCFSSLQTQSFATHHLKDDGKFTVQCCGDNRRGQPWLQKETIGTHSIQSGLAMSMYLGECPVYIMMMIG
eukprot:13961469-Ditylum_brightwellii.AAC.1